MLNELKDELEYCRRKWALAREKNNESQTQWNSLRKEFSNRKLLDANNSAESGYSDDPTSDDDHGEEGQSGFDVPREAERRRSASPAAQLNDIVPQSPRGTSAPPQWSTAETVIESLENTSVTEETIATQVNDNVLGFAAASSVIAIEVPAIPVRVKRVKTKKSKDNEAKKSSSEKQLPELCREKRLKEKVKKTVDTAGETLEQMFYRLSGQEPPAVEAAAESESESEEESEESSDEEEEQLVLEEPRIELKDIYEAGPSKLTTLPPPVPTPRIPSTFELEDEERRANRAARFQRLEEQCQQLINQVTKTSHRGDALNSQLDEVQRRYTPNRDAAAAVVPDEAGASGLTAHEEEYTSRRAARLKRLDEECKATTGVDPDEAGASGLTAHEEEFTSRRAARLKRLEAECKAYLDRVNTTNARASALDTKLTGLHERYGYSSSATTTDIVDEIDSLDDSSADELNVATLPDERAVATAILTNISESLDVAADEVYEQDLIIRHRTQSGGDQSNDDPIN